jgi:chemotaxis protein MotB
MIPKRPQRQEENVDAWLMSYADMITLLMCFFIIFVSVSEPKKEKISAIAEGMAGKFGAVNYQNPFTGSVRSLQATIEGRKLYKDVAVISSSRALSMELATSRFFANGGADIDEAMLPVLEEMVKALKDTDLAKYSISIESHTDDTPPKSGLFSNNWELSTVRAAKLAEFLSTRGIPSTQMKAVGYGDTRPAVPNLDAKGNPIPENRIKNQRVVLKVESLEN